MKILGIESSCDETAAAVVEDGYKLLSSVVSSSMDKHSPYGGIVPEIAARSHIEVIIPVIEEALAEASCGWPDIDALAVTYGPGLGGSLLIGVMAARTLAITKNLPLYSADHVLGHVYANFLTETPLKGYKLADSQPSFPLLAVIVSGGHSELVLFHDHFKLERLGRTQDDAIGEAFDKVAKIIGLGYPGGPAVAAAAEKGDPYSIPLPIAKIGGYDFSFSGLKTAVLRQAQAMIGQDFTFPSTKVASLLSSDDQTNLAASFQNIACQSITLKAKTAARHYLPSSVVLAGGVAANSELRRQLSKALDVPLLMPDTKLCTDNGAMIATLGSFMRLRNLKPANAFNLDIEPNLTI